MYGGLVEGEYWAGLCNSAPSTADQISKAGNGGITNVVLLLDENWILGVYLQVEKSNSLGSLTTSTGRTGLRQDVKNSLFLFSLLKQS